MYFPFALFSFHFFIFPLTLPLSSNYYFETNSSFMLQQLFAEHTPELQ